MQAAGDYPMVIGWTFAPRRVRGMDFLLPANSRWSASRRLCYLS